MTEIRCVKCNRLLMKAKTPYEVESKCPKCGYINHLSSSGSLFGMDIITDHRMKENTFKLINNITVSEDSIFSEDKLIKVLNKLPEVR